MSFLIGNARIDENNKAHGGQAGDQTGREVQVQSWYSYPWNVIVRAKDSATAEKVARSMEYACQNQNIGYDQYQRTTLFAKVAALGWNPENIAKVGSCETDCSALVAVCVNAAGVSVSKDIWTGNEVDALVATGKFTKLTDSKYLNSSDYLKRGDILVNTVHHTAIALSTGSKAGSTTTTTTTTTTKQTSGGVKMKAYKNGSTTEVVYSDPNFSNAIGSLNPYESCSCWGKIGDAYVVEYTVDSTNSKKVGFVQYSGGV